MFPEHGAVLSRAIGLWQCRAMLVILGGLPGTGKTTIGRALAHKRAACYLRIDALEAAMWRAGVARDQPTGLAAYVVAEAVAEASLRASSTVVVDAVNPIEAARQAWRALAARTSMPLRVIELVCSDQLEHRRRVETRTGDLEGHQLPTWADVLGREYEPWQEPRLVVDTSHALTDCLAQIEEYLEE